MLVMVLGSCKKCNEKDCMNGASCNLINNEAVCACKVLYQGDRCDIETRAIFVGIYNGTPIVTVNGIGLQGVSTEYSLEKNGEDISNFKISSTDPSDSTKYFCKLTSDTDFVIENVVVAGDDKTISGSGTISPTNFRISGTISQIQNEQTEFRTFVISASK